MKTFAMKCYDIDDKSNYINYGGNPCKIKHGNNETVHLVNFQVDFHSPASSITRVYFSYLSPNFFAFTLVIIFFL